MPNRRLYSKKQKQINYGLLTAVMFVISLFIVLPTICLLAAVIFPFGFIYWKDNPLLLIVTTISSINALAMIFNVNKDFVLKTKNPELKLLDTDAPHRIYFLFLIILFGFQVYLASNGYAKTNNTTQDLIFGVNFMSSALSAGIIAIRFMF